MIRGQLRSPDPSGSRSRTLITLVALTVLTVTLPTLSPAASAAEGDRLDRLIEKGVEALRAGESKKAAKRFEKADRLAGGSSPEALAGLARAHLALHHYEATIAEADRLLSVAENDRQRAKGHQLVGLAYFGLATADAAELIRGRTRPGIDVEGDPDELWETARETYRAAADAFRRVVETTGGEAEVAWQSWVDALYRAGDYEEARRVLDRFEQAAGGAASLPEDLRALAECVETASTARTLSDRAEEDAEIEPPEKIRAPQPRYTDAARRHNTQGLVVIETMIDREGRVVCPRVLRGLPDGLNDAALEAILQWRFEPATRDGEPIPVFYNLTVGFRRSS